MPPNLPQNQSVGPASLPPVSDQTQVPPSAAPMPQQPTSNQPTGVPATQQAVFQAKLLIEQYKNNPYRLALAMQQLKEAYLAQEFNVVPNAVEK